MNAQMSRLWAILTLAIGLGHIGKAQTQNVYGHVNIHADVSYTNSSDSTMNHDRVTYTINDDGVVSSYYTYDYPKYSDGSGYIYSYNEYLYGEGKGYVFWISERVDENARIGSWSATTTVMGAFYNRSTRSWTATQLGQYSGNPYIYNITLNLDSISWQINNSTYSYSIATQVLKQEFVPGSSAVFANLSTRGYVGTGNNAMIGGFVVGGSGTKDVLATGIGPSLVAYGVSNAILDPNLDLKNSGGSTIASNDDWGNAANASAISATGFAPSNSKEAAILSTLSVGSYSVIIGNGGTGNNGLYELYDISGGTSVRLVNVSTRAYVGTGNDVLIVGFVVSGGNKRVLINGKGPSLSNYGVTGAMSNPTVTLYDVNGTAIITNDNWKDAWNFEAINGTSYKPSNDNEASISEVLAPGVYTAVLSGVSSGTGVGLLEIFEL